MDGLLSFLSPEQQALADRQARQAMLTQLGFGLLQASTGAPGQRKPSLGQIVGQAGPGAMQAYQGSFDRTLQQIMLQQQMAQQQKQREAQEQQQAALQRFRTATQPVTPESALGMAGRVGPTAERAATIGQQPQMTRNQALQFGLDPDLPETLRKSLFDYAQATKPEEPKTPSSFQEFLLAQTNPAYREMLLERDRSKGVNVAMPKITIDMGNKFGDTLNKTLENIYDSGQKSRAVIPTVETMSVLLDEGIRTGFGQETFMKLNQAAQLFDPTFKAKEIAGQEAFVALSNEIILPQVKQLGVNPTDADLNFIKNGSPTLSKSVEGNKLLLDALKLKLQRDALLQEFATDWQSKNVSLLEQSPVRANSELRQAILNLTKTHPLYTQAAQQLRERYSAIVGGQRSAVLPSNNPFIRPR